MLFASFISYSQKTITGVVHDTLNIPLENANVIAKPFNANEQLKFAIADNKGRYKLELENTVKYEITVSYIGYTESVFVLEPNANVTTHNFILKNTGQILKEIIIKHEFKPVEIKKDTMTFSVKAFANGNERKLKEVLEKLPGVEVDKKGNVTVQGKKVTKMLVEGKSFFGGGSKLAVENIPADALDKIEVIDHFNEVGFLKKVSDSEDLAMNVKLKEDKKKFVFGDVEAAVEVAGDNGFYKAHAGIFYYSPKTNISYIGDSNNFGKSTLAFDDILRFDGGFSNFIAGRKSAANLYSFANDNTDVVINKSQFNAINLSHDFSSKLNISGYAIFSKIFTESINESRNRFFENTMQNFENKTENSAKKSFLGLANLKLDYSRNSKEKFYYSMQYQGSNNNINTTIESITNINNNNFNTIANTDNSTLKQYAEWHKSLNDNHTTTVAINHAFDKNTPTTNWSTKQTFFLGGIPLLPDANYKIEQIKTVTNQSVDALFKHYWVINNFNHLYTNIGNNYGVSSLETNEKQTISSGLTNNFAASGFGNNLQYNLNDAFVGLEYKFKLGRWVNRPGLYLHLYKLETNQKNQINTVNKTLFQPQWNSEFEFNQSESLNFSYNLSNTFPDINLFTNRFTLQNYNLIFKGNSLLENEKFHTSNLRYVRTNMYRGIMINASINYNKKIQTIRNEIQLSGINQFITPVLTNNPETNWRMNSSLSKKIYRFRININANLNWQKYIQNINNVTTNSERNSQKFGLSLKTAYRKWPEFNIGYTKGSSQLIGVTKTNFASDEFNSDLEIKFLKSWIFYTEYESFKNTDNKKQSNFFNVVNSSIRYQKKNSPYTFELLANNVLDNKIKNNVSVSDYSITESATFILPRAILFSTSYKL